MYRHNLHAELEAARETLPPAAWWRIMHTRAQAVVARVALLMRRIVYLEIPVLRHLEFTAECRVRSRLQNLGTLYPPAVAVSSVAMKSPSLAL